MFKIGCLIFLSLGWLSAGAQEVRSAQFAYLFGEESTFVKVDVQNYGISPIKNLLARTSLEEARHPVSDPSEKRLFLLTTKPSSKGISGGFRTQLAVLWTDLHGELGLSRRVDIGAPLTPDPVLGPHDSITGLGVSPDGKAIYISWDDEKSGPVTGVFDGTTYSKQKEVKKLFVNRWMCFSSDGKKLYTPWASEFLSFTLPDYALVGHINFQEKVGKKEFFSKSIMDVAHCKAVIFENASRPNPEQVSGTIYIYDIESNKVAFEMPINVLGDYLLVPGSGLLVLDEKKGISSAGADKTQAVRWEKAGKLEIYDIRTKEKRAVVDVPERGEHMWVSPDETRLYYLSPRRLTIVDLVGLNVLKTVEIPFVDAQLAFMQSQMTD
jgi:WD40-like Beta Propeller Repeat